MWMFMRVGIVVGMALVAGAVHAAALGQADRIAREKAMIAEEHRLVDAVVKGDVAVFKSLVKAEAWSISPSGAIPVAEFEKSMKDLKIEPGWTITEPRVVWAASNTAVLFYTFTAKGTYRGQPLPPVMFASTIWHESNKKWTAFFHQETPAAPK